MAQNITLLGANYPDVPAVTLPITGGGTATFSDTRSVTYNLTGGASASVNPSKVVAGQGFSVKLTAPTGYNLNNVTVTMGGVDITSQVFTPDEIGGGGDEPNLQTKSVSYTPTTSAQSAQVTADSGYDGLEQVNVSVGAIPSEYIIPTGTKSITENGTGIDVSAFALVDVAVPTSGSYKTKTGTFVGSGARTQTIACDFEPDVIWIHGTTDQASIRAMETFMLIRDTASYLRYYSSTSNTTSFSYTLKNGITGLDSDTTTSYSMQTTYANGAVSIYAYTEQNRYYFNSAITYSYKFIKYTS